VESKCVSVSTAGGPAQLGSSGAYSSAGMGWFTDFFSYELKKGYEEPAARQKAFEDRLDAALVKQDKE
jgi:hypothetical protein